MRLDKKNKLNPSMKSLTNVLYFLYVSSIFFGGITVFIASIINRRKLRDVSGTFLESHFYWQMQTVRSASYWAGRGIFVGLAIALSFYLIAPELLPIGSLIFGVVMVSVAFLVPCILWYLYHMIAGWYKLNKDQPMSPLRSDRIGDAHSRRGRATVIPAVKIARNVKSMPAKTTAAKPLAQK